MKIIDGNLLELAKQGKFEVIVHGSNCFCTMGSGIAVQIKNAFPEMYSADQETESGDKNKLGTYTIASIIRDDVSFFGVNAYTQYDFGTDKIRVDYKALRSCFKKIAEDFKDCSIGYPQIGAGLAGGNWDIISSIIDHELNGFDHTLVMFKG